MRVGVSPAVSSTNEIGIGSLARAIGMQADELLERQPVDHGRGEGARRRLDVRRRDGQLEEERAPEARLEHRLEPVGEAAPPVGQLVRRRPVQPAEREVVARQSCGLEQRGHLAHEEEQVVRGPGPRPRRNSSRNLRISGLAVWTSSTTMRNGRTPSAREARSATSRPTGWRGSWE